MSTAAVWTDVEALTDAVRALADPRDRAMYRFTPGDWWPGISVSTPEVQLAHAHAVLEQRAAGLVTCAEWSTDVERAARQCARLARRPQLDLAQPSPAQWPATKEAVRRRLVDQGHPDDVVEAFLAHLGGQSGRQLVTTVRGQLSEHRVGVQAMVERHIQDVCMALLAMTWSRVRPLLGRRATDVPGTAERLEQLTRAASSAAELELDLSSSIARGDRPAVDRSAQALEDGVAHLLLDEVAVLLADLIVARGRLERDFLTSSTLPWARQSVFAGALVRDLLRQQAVARWARWLTTRAPSQSAWHRWVLAARSHPPDPLAMTTSGVHPIAVSSAEDEQTVTGEVRRTLLVDSPWRGDAAVVLDLGTGGVADRDRVWAWLPAAAWQENGVDLGSPVQVTGTVVGAPDGRLVLRVARSRPERTWRGWTATALKGSSSFELSEWAVHWGINATAIPLGLDFGTVAGARSEDRP